MGCLALMLDKEPDKIKPLIRVEICDIVDRVIVKTLLVDETVSEMRNNIEDLRWIFQSS